MFAIKACGALFTWTIKSGLPPVAVERIQSILFALDEIENPDELTTVRTWKIHPLTGNRKGTFSLTVTANWRITFSIDVTANEIVDLNFEDYY